MTGSLQTTNVIQTVLDAPHIKDSLSGLGWKLDRCSETIVLAQKIDHTGREFSAFLSWQPYNVQTIINLRVLETTSREGQLDCERLASEILQTLGQ